MIIYPAIDIKDGQCVRLTQGLADQKTNYYSDPVEPARVFQAEGTHWVHVVDLDGAFTGKGSNLHLVRQIAELGLKVQLGGGMREIENIERALEAGVSRVVVGTRASKDPEFVALAAEKFGAAVAVGIDAKDGKVAVRGWVDVTDVCAIALAKSVVDAGIQTLIYTDIATDGMMSGPNLEAQAEMCEAVNAQVIASGGVARREDIIRLNELAQRLPSLHGAIVGKALYEKTVTLPDLIGIVGTA